MGKLSKEGLATIKQLVLADNIANTHNSELLLGHIDAIEAEKDRLINSVENMQRAIDLYRRGVNKLQEQLDAKKVVLPKAIANDIERFKAIGCDLPAIIYTFASGGDVNNHSFADYAADNFFKLLSALVNGYTVEEEPTTEERIKNKLYEELVFQGIQSPIEVSKLAQNLTLAIREILAEDAVKQYEAE